MLEERSRFSGCRKIPIPPPALLRKSLGNRDPYWVNPPRSKFRRRGRRRHQVLQRCSNPDGMTRRDLPRPERTQTRRRGLVARAAALTSLPCATLHGRLLQRAHELDDCRVKNRLYVELA